MSYKTPEIASLTLLGIDKKCQDISSHMTDLTWLTYAFGLADRMVELRDNKDYIYPSCYISNTKDPVNTLPSDLYNAFCFWVKDPEALFNYENNPDRMYYKISCIFYMSLEKISPYVNYKETKTKLRQDIIKFFDEHKDGGAFGVMELVRIVDDDITEVYKEFSIEQVDNRFKMFPKYALRIDFNFAFLLECPPTAYNSFVSDIDGNVYSTVVVGTQEWMVENLRTTKYADGTLIPNVTTVANWTAENGTTGHDGAYCWYNNLSELFNDWSLPSKEELNQMYINLHLEGVGGFTDYYYITSTQHASVDVAAWYQSFLTGVQSSYDKASSQLFRACRVFTDTIGAYNLRDIGPAGGLIFYISGTTYYEAAASDTGTAPWCNNGIRLINIAGAQGAAIGTGQANTTAIINQVGHTDSAAKLCDDLIIGYKDTYGAIYNGYAVKNPHGLAPSGWRIPTKTDRDTLIAFCGGTGLAGGKLKEVGTTHWLTPNTGAVDTYGWKGVPSGYRAATATFNALTLNAYFWTVTPNGVNLYAWNLSYDSDNVIAGDYEKRNGYAVRCVRDI